MYVCVHVDSLCDALSDEAAYGVTSSDGQLTTTSHALTSTLGPAKLAWHQLETLGGVLMEHPV